MHHHHKRYFVILMLAALCLGVSVYLGLVLRGDWLGPIATPEVVLEAGESFLRELGFAFIIAWMVSIGIEAHARSEDGKRADALRRDIALDVFKGVFSHRLPRAYIDRVVESHLYPIIVREISSIKLILRLPKVDEVARWNIPSDRFLIVKQTISFTVRNTATGRHHHLLKLKIPSRPGHLGEVTYVENATVRNLSVLTDEAASSIAEGASRETKHYEWPLVLEADEAVPVVFESQLLKEVSDSELTSFSLPTMRVEFEIENHVPGLRFGIRSTGPRLQQTPAEDILHCSKWVMQSPILANESVVVWWSRADED